MHSILLQLSFVNNLFVPKMKFSIDRKQQHGCSHHVRNMLEFIPKRKQKEIEIESMVTSVQM